MSVKIDKYISIIDKSGLIGWIRDESNERVIIKINMDTKENTKKMLDMCLDALNTGAFEPVDESDDDGLGNDSIVDVGGSVSDTGDSVPNNVDSEPISNDDSNGDLNNGE